MQPNHLVYLDHAATTALSARALQAMQPYLHEAYGNPESPHRLGEQAHRAVVFARETVAKALGAKPKEVIFTAGGTEANHQALWTAAFQGRRAGRMRLVTDAMEHKAVLEPLRFLEELGWTVDCVAPRADGRVHVEDVAARLSNDVALVSVMMVNNEVGTRQPVEAIAEAAHAVGARFHTDAVQAVGQEAVDFDASPFDFLSLSGHKFNGPKGVGALLVKEGIEAEPLLRAGGQERGKRAGTHYVAGIVGLAEALRERMEQLDENRARVRFLRKTLVQQLQTLPGVAISVPEEGLESGIVSFTLDHGHREVWLAKLSRAGICASSGSACTAGAAEDSHVLVSLGMDPARRRAALRFSLGADNTEEELRYAVQVLRDLLASAHQRRKGENG